MNIVNIIFLCVTFESLFETILRNMVFDPIKIYALNCASPLPPTESVPYEGSTVTRSDANCHRVSPWRSYDSLSDGVTGG